MYTSISNLNDLWDIFPQRKINAVEDVFKDTIKLSKYQNCELD